MQNFTLEIGSDGVAVVAFNVPDRSVNTITFSAVRDLVTLTETVRDDAKIVGLVIHSTKSSGFCAGADLGEMEGKILEWRAAHAQHELREGVKSAGNYSRALRALETIGKPVAMIAGGVAVGGGLELVLSGHYRLATGDPGKLKLALPEVTIGLMPGAGATQRLPRLMGIGTSLPHLVDGTPIDLAAALEAKIFHDHVLDPDAALAQAKKWVADNPQSSQSWDVKGYRLAAGPHSPIGYATLPPFIARILGDAPHDHAGRANILRAVYEGTIVPIDAALRIETRYFFNTVRAPSSGAMLQTLFAAKQAVAKAGRSDPKIYVDRLRRAWHKAIDELTSASDSPSLIYGISRSLSRELAPKSSSLSARSFELVSSATVASVSHRLLSLVALEAQACLADGIVASRDAADLYAIEGGFPASTGGPISFLRAGERQQSELIRRRMEEVVSDGELAMLFQDISNQPTVPGPL